MTVEARELYCYVTGTKPFCDEIDKIIKEMKQTPNEEYYKARLRIAGVLGKAMSQYKHNFGYWFSYMDEDAVQYKILSEIYPII